jgi:ABC-type nitrate/sulfonate/bicarbonate transport system substrate-binding protein
MNKRILIGIIGIITVVVIVGSYFWLKQRKPEINTGRPIEKVTIGVGTAPLSLLIWIAENEGYFAKNGLDAEIIEFPSGKAAVGALIEGKVDLATITEFGFTSKSFNEKDIRVVASIAVANINSLIARKDKGIKKISDLKGKRIVTVSGTEADFFLGTFLIFNDIFIDDVEIIYKKASDIVQIVSNGEADAAMIWEPNVYKIKTNLNENCIIWSGQNGQSSYWLLNSKKDFIAENPEIVKRVLKALLQAEEFVKTNNTKAKAILMSHDLDAQFVDDIWHKFDYTISLPQTLIIVMEDGARWKILNNLTDATEVPNYLNYIYIDALAEVKPDAVTILR